MALKKTTRAVGLFLIFSNENILRSSTALLPVTPLLAQLSL